MENILFYIPDMSPALSFAAAQLQEWGFSITALPCPGVTHVLLGVPTKDMPPAQSLPEGVTIFGGSLGDQPCNAVDLLHDEEYLTQNAAITAHCAAMLAMEQLPVTLEGCETLIIGWGRISKRLVPMLNDLGAVVTVSSRSGADRFTLKALGYSAVDTAALDPRKYRLIINTAPAPVLDGEKAAHNTVLIDLASKRGISGDNVIWARGLPGKYAPESSGKLIAKTILRYIGKEKP